MRSALGRSGVASTVAFADRDRRMREQEREDARLAIWNEKPRQLEEGQVCFRIASPKGWSVMFDMQPAEYQNGVQVKAPKSGLIQFVEDPCGHFGEFITKDPAAIKRLRMPDAVARGVQEWNKLHALKSREAGEQMAEKLKDESFFQGVISGLKKLGISDNSAFLDALGAPKAKAPKQEAQQQAGA